MKKLLAFLLILGMASMAQAGFILSVNGSTDHGGVIEMEPSDYVTLDVHIDPGTLFTGGDFLITLNNTQASIDGADVVFPVATLEKNMMGTWYLEDEAGFSAAMTPVPANIDAQNYYFSGGDLLWNATNNPDDYAGMPPFIPAVGAESYPVLMDGLLFHCFEESDVVVDLVAPYGLVKYLHDAEGAVIGTEVIAEPGAVLDTLTVIQIPEPMTMSLLGLGGLALLRRRRA